MVNKKEVKKKKPEKGKILKEINKKQNKQIMWAIILMASLILIIIFVPLIVKNFFNKFVYMNLDWQKTKLGDIMFYSTRVPIANLQGTITGSYSMNFRNDPRKLDNISVYVFEDWIEFEKDKPVYITLYPEMEACEDNSIALINLVGFLRDFAGLNVKSAVSKLDYAKKNNLSYVTCKNTPNNTVIYINSGTKTEISKINPNCYEIIYNNCEIIPVTEKFMLIILGKYMGYFTRDDKSFLDMFK